MSKKIGSNTGDNIEDFYDYVNLMENTPQLGILGFLREKLLAFEEDRVETAIKLMPAKNSRILDIGCNDGCLLINASGKFKRAAGVDLSKKVLAIASENLKNSKLSSRVSLQKANIETGLPFKAGTFDLVTCLAVVEHLFDPEKAILEMRRVIKKNGYLIVEVPNLAWLPRRLTLFFGKRPRTSWAPGWDGGHIAYFTFESFIKLLQQSGFQISKIGCSGVFAGIRYLHPPLLSGNIVVLAKRK